MKTGGGPLVQVRVANVVVPVVVVGRVVEFVVVDVVVVVVVVVVGVVVNVGVEPVDSEECRCSVYRCKYSL